MQHGAPLDGPSPFAPRSGPGGLPAEVDRLVGRDAELSALRGRLERSRLVTVTGTGGVGKTRLALAAASGSQDRFCGGVRLVELSMVRDAPMVDRAVLEALAVTDHSARPPRSVLAEYLADRELLLVLDGCEYLVAECAALAAELLRRAPGLRILATGRRPLGVPGESVLPLGPLELADQPDGESSAVRLFAERAVAVVPSFAVTEANRAAVGALCRRLDGLPLALELAAVRLRTMSVERIAERITDRFQLLAGGDRAALPRRQTLRAVIGWSHELCTPTQRLLWARLSVFAGEFDLDAVEYVCTGSGLPAEEVRDTVAALVAQSVVIRDEAAEGARYRMLEPVREYGAGWLEALGDTERLRRRHRDWYLGLATSCELDWFGPGQAEVAARVDRDLRNLRLALEFGLERASDPHIGQYLAGSLWFYWVGCGRLSEGRHWLDRALRRPGGNDGARAKALWVLGYVAALQGDTVAAVAALDECRALAERTGNAAAAAYAVHRIGCVALLCHDVPRAAELFGAALARYREIGELNSHVLLGRVGLALAMALRGDLEGAVAQCEQVRGVCLRYGERWALAYALYVLGYAAWRGGAGARAARELLCEGLAIHHALRDPVGMVVALELLAQLTDDGQGAAARAWPSLGGLRGGAHLDLDTAVSRALSAPTR
ncbi:ATP-binding protein [Streptomyces sp. RPT161]|uniref:ATP-binding protein n=1 Tax=Streptomyces sp. RPT161 TaxID=3015993 RepID=UPI0022B87D80|nr:regulator [Streptomyces sp. RPT161]